MDMLPHRAAGADHAAARPPGRLLCREPRGPAGFRVRRGRTGMSGDLLSVEDVTRSYALGGLFGRGHFDAVEDVSFSIPDGKPEIFTIVGESGSGKSTLARMILNLAVPTSGTIRLRGTDVTTCAQPPRPAGVHGGGAADLPEPVRGLQSAEAGRPLPADDRAQLRRARRRGARRRPPPTRRCARSGSRSPRSSGAFRTSCPAASCSASRSRAR